MLEKFLRLDIGCTSIFVLAMKSYAEAVRDLQKHVATFE